MKAAISGGFSEEQLQMCFCLKFNWQASWEGCPDLQGFNDFSSPNTCREGDNQGRALAPGSALDKVSTTDCEGTIFPAQEIIFCLVPYSLSP